MPLTPSPRTPKRSSDAPTETIHGGNFLSRLQRSVTKTNRESPKSNIARTHTPKRLELGVSEWSLTGSGTSTSTSKTPKAKKDTTIRARPTKTRIAYNAADRFIPNRSASEAICNVGTGKLDLEQRPKSSSMASEGSTVLATAASAFDVGGRGSEDDVTLSLEGLNLNDDEEESSKPKSGDAVAYQSSLASACGVSLNTRILAFKPAPPESSKPIDLRSQYNRPLKPASALNAQNRRRIPSAPERVLDAPGLEIGRAHV